MSPPAQNERSPLTGQYRHLRRGTLDFTTGRDDCIDHFAVKRVQLIRPADRQPGDTFPDFQSNRLAHRPSPIAVERNRAWSISLRPSATRRGVAA